MQQLQTIISEKQFREILETGLENHIDRALTTFNNFGKMLSYDVTNVMPHAVDKKKVEEVLSTLEKHWEEHLQYQHPEIRGTVESMPGVNLTQRMFLDVCTKALALTPQ